MARENTFLAIAERLQTAGLSLDETAIQLIAGAENADHWVSGDPRQVVAWAGHAGWREIEVKSGISSLIKNYALSVEAWRKTNRSIRLAWRTAD